jgi:hypothetical protein
MRASEEHHRAPMGARSASTRAVAVADAGTLRRVRAVPDPEQLLMRSPRGRRNNAYRRFGYALPAERIAAPQSQVNLFEA